MNRRSGKIIYRVVLTVVIVVFTLVFIGPLYFLFTDGLKSTQEAIATPPTLYPHHAYPGSYVQSWNRLDVALMLWNSLYYAFGALAFQLVFDVAAAYALSKLRPVFGGVAIASAVDFSPSLNRKYSGPMNTSVNTTMTTVRTTR